MEHYRLPGQRYKCGNAQNGTPCYYGPIGARCSQRHTDPAQGITCRPIRTLRWWNRSIQLATTLIAIVAVSLAWSNVGGKNTIAPGSLSRSHAQLLVSSQHKSNGNLSIDSENRCAACHPGLEGSASTMAESKQSDLCMKCHVQEMPDAVHGSPHDLHGNSLEQLLARGDQTKTNSTWAKFISRSTVDWNTAPLECGQCHREHQGAFHNLKDISSQRCQACHRDQYQSFSTDHPEFKTYPYGRTKNIEFDHRKHQDLHFSKKGASFDCKSCHVQSEQVGVVGQVFRSIPFEQACASCHTEPIKSAIQDGLIVLQVPSINRKELLLAGTDIGKWPMQASQLTDGTIPPIMRLLMESEPGGKALLSELPITGRLVELDANDGASQATLLKLSAMTKRLFRKLANEGQRGFRSSVEKLISTSSTVPPNPSSPQSSYWLDKLANGVPPDLFRAAWSEWFEDGKTTPIASQAKPNDPNAIRPAPVRFSSTIRRQDDDLLGDIGSLIVPKADDKLNSDPSNLLHSQTQDDSEALRFKDSRAWDQLAFGGWMIDRQRMAIVYIPKGHADEWLSKWIELEEFRPSRHLSLDTQGTQNKIELAKQCRQCHALHSTVEKTPLDPSRPTKWSVAFRFSNESSLRQDSSLPADDLNECWKAKRRAANLRPITKFDHTPHLTLPSISDCRSCHQLLSNTDLVSSHQEFAPMQKSQCASCHQPNAAGDSCTQCHNYHVGNRGWFEGN